MGLGDGQHSRAKLGAAAIAFVSRFEKRKAVEQPCCVEVLLCNLFAMPPMYHLGECLGILWVCCSPCLVPDAQPHGFEASFLSSFPELALVLRARDEGLGSRTAGFSSRLITSCSKRSSWDCHRCRHTENETYVKTEFWPPFTENHSLL